MENEQENQETETAQDNQEYVSIPEASIEDLDTFIAQNNETEKGSEEVVVAPNEVQSEEQPETQVQTQSPSEEIKTPDTKEAAKPRTYTEDEVAQIRAENSRLKASTEQKELFIQRRNTELGELKRKYDLLRNEKVQRREKLLEGLEDRYHENPIKAQDDRDQIKQLDSEIQAIDQHSNRAERIVESQKVFFANIDTNKISIDDMAEVLKADGIDESHILQMKSNPWEWTHPETLIQIGKRAEERKALSKAQSDLKVLANHIVKMEKESKNLRARPNQVLNNVQKHLNQSPPVTSGNGVSAQDTRSNLDPTKMSIAELDAFLAKAH